MAVVLAIAGCGEDTNTAAGDAPVQGGTATYALPADVTPNYIFPFAPGPDFTIVNLNQFQYLMYRPLYWFGKGTSPLLNRTESLAYPPTFSGQVVTIKLKPYYTWTNGEHVDAQDVMFWMNMMKEEAHTEYGGYVPGGMPDDVTNVHAVGTYEVQMTIKGKYSSLWFTDNQLSQITPMPMAWDLTSATTKSDCAGNPADCPAVFKYLNSIGDNTSKWVDSPVWGIVDGPWRLTSYSSSGVLTFNYNAKYRGQVPKDHISTFIEEPYTSEESEFNVLQAGGKEPLDVGYLPTVDAPVPPPGKPVGENPVPGYKMTPLWAWGINYIPYNFNSADPQVAVFKQEYFRQAFQYLVNQAGIIQGALHGYGIVSTGPVGDAPQTDYLSPEAKRGDPFPYNLPEAVKLLKDHGWTVRPGGVTICSNPGVAANQCGEGVKGGAKLNVDLYYVTGNAWVQAAVLQIKSNAASVGIQVSLSSGSFDQVVGTVEGVCSAAPKPCPWEMADWGQGWSYEPDFLPTGDELYGTGSAGNLGQYSNARNDQLIKATVETSNTRQFLKDMYAWEAYLTPQLPVMLQPEAPFALMETIKNLQIGPQSPTLTMNPEDWYFTQ
ncbi:MAG TPA: ABC transporter substrate-binding protein [Streptosporangiaceae bacterium]|nr:ABC transporter substrate-binding protein [Streptosporangiaceae bacterium]